MNKAAASLVLGAALAMCRQASGDTLLDVYRLAEQKDAQFRSVKANREAVLELKPQTRAQAFLPQVGISSNANYNWQDNSNFQNNLVGRGIRNTNFLSYDYSLNLVQPVFRYDRWVAYDQADLRIQQAGLDVVAEQQDLAVRVSERYFDILAALDGLAYAQAQKKALQRQLDQAKQRFEVGLTAITDVQEAQAGYDRAVSEEIQAQNQIDITGEALREISGEYHTEISGLAAEVPLVKPEPASIEKWTQQAVQQNLRLASALANADVAREEIKRQRAGHLPSLDIVGNHGFASRGGPFGFDSESSQIGVQLNMPIFQGGFVNSKTREAEQLYQVAQEQVEQRRRAAHRDARTSYLNVMSGISRVDALKQAVVSNETAVKSTEAGFEVGTRTAVDVVTSERQLFLARRDYARAKYDYLLDTLRLKRAVGILSLDELAKVDNWLQHKGSKH